MTTCGYCSGRGWVLGRAYDREGRAQVPPRVCCEYCAGSGACDRGDELAAAGEPKLDAGQWSASEIKLKEMTRGKFRGRWGLDHVRSPAA